MVQDHPEKEKVKGTQDMAKKKETVAPSVDESVEIFDHFIENFDHLQSGDGLGGFESLNAEVIAYPFIRVLQQLSPQLNKKKQAYVEGAQEGMLYNNVSDKCYEVPVEVVVGRFDRYFIEWQPERGGFAGAHMPEAINAMIQRSELKRDERNRLYSPETKNTFADTYVYYILFPDFLEDGVCLLSLSSTQLKEAKRWNRLLLTTFIPGTNRRAQPYFMRWTITTPEMSNDKGDWCGFRVDFAGFVGPETLQIVSDERKALPSDTMPNLKAIEGSIEEIQEDAIEGEYIAVDKF